MTEIQHQFASIYDKLNNLPDIQELISTPILDELDTQEDQMFYRQRAQPWQNLNIYNLNTIIDCCGWDIDEYPGSFASYILQVMTPAER